ncbi:MAG TPA: arsenic resistance N-acetyltransferase ArsN2 [Polyangiaceae bacterium]
MSSKVVSDRLVLEPASAVDLGTISHLLEASDLPVADLEDHLRSFVLAKWQGEVVGAVGLENYGECGLLRSLCVRAERRSEGIGGALLLAIEAAAFARGVRDLYLLTFSAAPYFENQQFVEVARDRVPAAIRGTAQFRTLCPASATCMRKRLPRATPD